MRHAEMIIAVFAFHAALAGCDGGSNKPGALGTSGVEESPSRNSVVVDAPATDGVSVAGQQDEALKDSESVSSSAAAQTGFALWLGNDRKTGAALPSESSVSGVEKVSSPFGPFPETHEPTAYPSSAETAAAPPEPPETPRSPFGPFPTSQ